MLAAVFKLCSRDLRTLHIQLHCPVILCDSPAFFKRSLDLCKIFIGSSILDDVVDTQCFIGFAFVVLGFVVLRYGSALEDLRDLFAVVSVVQLDA